MEKEHKIPCKELKKLQEEGKVREKRLSNLEKIVEENNILQNDALGIKKKENGERQKQIEEALKRISEIGNKTEDEDKNLRQLLIEVQLEVAKLSGYIQGQDKREADKIKTDALDLTEKGIKVDRVDKYMIMILTSIIGVALFVAGLLIG